jgi:DNA polymerase-1
MTGVMALTRAPARVSAPGTFPLVSLAARYTVGHEATAQETEQLIRSGQESGLLAVDIEGCGKDGRIRFDVKCVGISTADHVVLYDPRDPAQFQDIRRVINTTGYNLAYHNSPFDVPIMYCLGLLDMETVSRVTDTLIYARLAEPDERTRKSLTNASNTYLGTGLVDPLAAMLKTLGISKAVWYETKDLDVPGYRIMAGTDPILTYRLLPKVREAAYNQLTSGHPFTAYGLTGSEALEEIEKPQIINRQTLRRACKGFLIDPEYLDTYMEATAAELADIELELDALDIRPGNASDLTSYLDRNGMLPATYPRTKKTKAPSGAKDHLKLLGDPVAQRFTFHKEETHIIRDYLSKSVTNSDKWGRVHPGANILSAQTGRMSYSGDTPLHQFSAPARGIILADNWEEARAFMRHPVLDVNGDPHKCTCRKPKGMVSIDWSQIEPVIVANVAGDKAAVARYEAGEKFYDAVAKFAGISYKIAKVVLLAQLYGEGLPKLATDLRITVEEAKKIRDMIWKVLPGTQRLAGKNGTLQNIAQQYQKVFTLSGRIVPVPAGRWPCWNSHETLAQIANCGMCDADGTKYSVAVHKGVNYFVQGSAYDLLANAMVETERAGLGDALYMAMHDELVVDADAAHDIRRIMETPPPRLIMMAKRTPVLRTDMAHLGERWCAA